MHIIHYLLYQKRIQSCRKSNSQRTEVYILYVNSFTFKCFGHQNENIIEWKLMTGNLFHSNKNRLVTCDFLSLSRLNRMMVHKRRSSTESPFVTFLVAQMHSANDIEGYDFLLKKVFCRSNNSDRFGMGVRMLDLQPVWSCVW